MKSKKRGYKILNPERFSSAADRVSGGLWFGISG
jgi:hypothetical protein